MRIDFETKEIGGRIRQLRIQRGLTQDAVAAPRYTAAFISQLENGKRGASHHALSHIAQRLGVPLDQLITGRDPAVELQLQLRVDQAFAEIHSGDLVPALEKLENARKRARTGRFTRVQAAAEEGLGLIAQREARWTDALSHFETAEQLLADEPVEARTSAITARARCLFATNQLSRAIHLLEGHLVELEQRGGDPLALVQTYSALIGPYFEAGLKDRAAAVAEEANRLAANVEDPEHVACMHINRAQILLEQGHHHEAMRSLARAEDLYKQIGWRDSAASAAVALAIAAVETGDLAAGERRARSALAELERSPDKLAKARAFNLLARIARLQGRPEEALSHLDEVRRLLGKEKSMEQAWRLRETALCHIDLGDLEAAEQALRQALKMYEAAKAPHQIATTAAYLGDVLRELGRTDEAVEVYRAGLAEVEDLAV